MEETISNQVTGFLCRLFDILKEAGDRANKIDLLLKKVFKNTAESGHPLSNKQALKLLDGIINSSPMVLFSKVNMDIVKAFEEELPIIASPLMEMANLVARKEFKA